MLFDGAFEYLRFYALVFMIIGINMRYLKERRTTNIGYQIKPQTDHVKG